MNNKKQDWRTADKANRDELRNTEINSKNASGKKPLNESTQTESVPGTRAGQRSSENRNHGKR